MAKVINTATGEIYIMTNNDAMRIRANSALRSCFRIEMSETPDEVKLLMGEESIKKPKRGIKKSK